MISYDKIVNVETEKKSKGRTHVERRVWIERKRQEEWEKGQNPFHQPGSSFELRASEIRKVRDTDTRGKRFGIELGSVSQSSSLKVVAEGAPHNIHQPVEEEWPSALLCFAFCLFFFLVCGKKTASFKVAVAEMKSHFTFRSFHFVPPSFGTWGDRKFHPFLFWLSFFFYPASREMEGKGRERKMERENESERKRRRYRRRR